VCDFRPISEDELAVFIAEGPADRAELIPRS
jgi:hypothetical protein